MKQSNVFGGTDTSDTAGKNILFICTGNTCRSPMAEAVMRKRIAELARDDIKVSSAGTSAYPGEPISKNSVAALMEIGIDYSAYSSRLVNLSMLLDADMIYTMTSAHMNYIINFPGLGDNDIAGKCVSFNIPDPFGGNLEKYRQTLVCIMQEVYSLVI